MIYDVLEAEEMLIDEGYIVVRPEEKLYIVKKFGKTWIIVSDSSEEAVRHVLADIGTESELRRAFYCVEAVEIS